MNTYLQLPIISTIKEKCKICYTCVRECPARAIGISEGQAQIIQEKCIHCGNCIKVCSREAKTILNEIDKLDTILKTAKIKIAIIAPSFPAEFIYAPYTRFIGSLFELGFDHVCEVAFGADVVAGAYKELLLKDENRSWIASTCPAVVSYVEKYQVELIPHLAPIVSPMVAMAKIVKLFYDENSSVVFIGPCIAKKHEARISNNDIDLSLTFKEIKEYFIKNNIDWRSAKDRDFDPPHSNTGGMFAISGGLLQTAHLKEDLLTGDIVKADGRINFVQALRSFKKEELRPKLLETLSCEGCIMGPGFAQKLPLYKKRDEMSRYLQSRTKTFDELVWSQNIIKTQCIKLEATFTEDNQRVVKPGELLIKNTLFKLGKKSSDDELNCGACGYSTCKEHAIAIILGVAENEMCLPYTIERLKTTITDLEYSYDELKRVKQILNHREKLASMGQLAAGIAHEVNNPLGVVLMYAHILLEQHGQDPNLTHDLEMIVAQSNRCKKIVSGLLNFSRQNKVLYEKVNIYDLTNHCADSIGVNDHIKIKIITLYCDSCAEVDKDQISQVLINLINNAIDALEDQKGIITITIDGTESTMIIKVKDNGPGIPEKIKPRIFDPFFTTKQIGKGTGLGLPVCYGIVKMHRGNVTVHSNTNIEEGETGTEVIIELPRYEQVIKRREENVQD